MAVIACWDSAYCHSCENNSLLLARSIPSNTHLLQYPDDGLHQRFSGCHIHGVTPCFLRFGFDHHGGDFLPIPLFNNPSLGASFCAIAIRFLAVFTAGCIIVSRSRITLLPRSLSPFSGYRRFQKNGAFSNHSWPHSCGVKDSIF